MGIEDLIRKRDQENQKRKQEAQREIERREHERRLEEAAGLKERIRAQRAKEEWQRIASTVLNDLRAHTQLEKVRSFLNSRRRRQRHFQGIQRFSEFTSSSLSIRTLPWKKERNESYQLHDTTTWRTDRHTVSVYDGISVSCTMNAYDGVAHIGVGVRVGDSDYSWGERMQFGYEDARRYSEEFEQRLADVAAELLSRTT